MLERFKFCSSFAVLYMVKCALKMLATLCLAGKIDGRTFAMDPSRGKT